VKVLSKELVEKKEKKTDKDKRPGLDWKRKSSTAKLDSGATHEKYSPKDTKSPGIT